MLHILFKKTGTVLAIKKAAKYAGSKRKAYLATLSKIMKAVWAWAKDMRKVVTTAVAMETKKESKVSLAPKDYEIVINLDSALYVINRSEYDSLMDSMMRGQNDIGDTPFGNLYEVGHDEIAASSYLSSLPVKSNPFDYVSKEWAKR